MIERQQDPDLKLTTFTCTETLTPDEVAAQLQAFYDATPTLHTIWDYTGADLSALTSERISELAGFLKQTAHSRAGGRSAMVFSLVQLQLINDRLPSLAELALEDGTIKIFSELAKARAWISE